MLQDKLKGWLAGVILFLIAASFIFFGMERFIMGAFSGSGVAVKVGSQKIMQKTVDNYAMQMQQQYPNIESAKLKEMILQQLISNAIATQSAKDLGLLVTDSQVYANITSDPKFQQNGQFSQQLFGEKVGNVQAYQDQVRATLLQNQLASSFSLTYAPDSVVNTIIGLNKQTRDISYVLLSDKNFMQSVVDPKEREILAYYVAHKSDFVQPERVKLNYILVSPKDLQSKIKVTDAEMKQYYNSNLDAYKTPAKWQVVSVKIPFSGGLGDKSYTDAKDKLDVMHKSLSAKGKTSLQDFQSLAQKNSYTLSRQSWVSAASGAAELPMLVKINDKNDYSIPFVNGNNLEMLYVTDIQPAKQKTFTEVKNMLQKNLTRQKASAAATKISDRLSDLTYTNSNSLQPAAKALGLKVTTSDWLTKNEQPTKKDNSALLNKNVLRAAFSEDVLQNGYNSNVINMDNGSLIVLRVAEKQSAQTLPLEKVKNKIITNIKSTAAEKNMQKFILQLQTKVRAGNMSKDLLNTKSLSWKNVNGLAVSNKKVPSQISVQAFLMRPAVAPAKNVATVAMPDGETAVLVLNGVHASTEKVTDKKIAQMRVALTQQKAADLLALYYKHKKLATKIKKYKS